MRNAVLITFFLVLSAWSHGTLANSSELKMLLWTVNFSEGDLAQMRSLMHTAFGESTSKIMDHSGETTVGECWGDLDCYPYADKTLVYQCALGCENLIKWYPEKCDNRDICLSACGSLQEICQKRCVEKWEIIKKHIPREFW